MRSDKRKQKQRVPDTYEKNNCTNVTNYTDYTNVIKVYKNSEQVENTKSAERQKLVFRKNIGRKCRLV